jgi:GNAT superfamily N-acetyltransferase
MYNVTRVIDNVERIKWGVVEFAKSIDVDCDPDQYIRQWNIFIQTGIGKLWCLDKDGIIIGGIGGIVVPDILTGKSMMVELFWYVTPEHRNRGILLFNTMEEYVDIHSLKWAMIHMERSMPDKLKLFYTKRGFRLLETHWIRDAKGESLCQ